MTPRPVKFVFFIENVLGLYRNYLFFSKINRLLACIRTVIEIPCMITSLVVSISYNYESPRIILTYGYSFFIMSLSWYHAKKIKQITMYFNTCSEYFPENAETAKCRARLIGCFLSVIFSLVNMFCDLYYCSTYVYRDLAMIEVPIAVYIFFQCLSKACDFRFLIEFAVLWTVFLSISDQLNSITQLIEKEIVSVRRQNNVKSSNCINVYRDVILFDKWSAAAAAGYKIMVKMSDLCNDVFYLQLTVMISVVVTSYIALMYGVIASNLAGTSFPLMQFLYVITLSNFFCALLMVSHAAQKIAHSGDSLKQLLARLLTLSPGELQYRWTRDFLRVVTAHPIQMKAFGSIGSVGMAVLPTCIAISTSYLVIALQFNNVV